jgi:transposase
VPVCHVTKSLFFKELKFIKQVTNKKNKFRIFEVHKVSKFEVCPKCAHKCSTIYDHVYITIRDAPIRGKQVILKIRKRRFKCKNCNTIFREPVDGIKKGFRTTQKFRRHLMFQASNFETLKRVAKENRCSNWLVYKAYFEQIELETRKLQNPWPKTIGIDEHSFIRNKYGHRDFATIFVNYNNKRVQEVVYGRSPANLRACDNLKKIPGRHKVQNVIIDLSSSFKSFTENHFPNATITVDKFHVLKLLSGPLQKYKKEVIGRERSNPFKKMLLMNAEKLQHHERRVLRATLHFYPNLKDLYTAKEALHSFYRINGYKRASKALTRLTDWLAYSKVPELQTLRTLMKWRKEILNYFKSRLTNGRTEGYNRKAKVIQRNAYGFRNFKNYRLKLIYLCR